MNEEGPNSASLAEKLDRLVGSPAKDRKLLGFVVFFHGNPARLETLAREEGLRNVGLAYLDDGWDFGKHRQDVMKLYKLDPTARNTILVYKADRVVATFVDVEAQDFGSVEDAVRRIPR